MLFLALPLLAGQVQVQPQAFDYAAFKATRLDPRSDPALVKALDRLYLDCPSIRAMLAGFATAHPLVILGLGTFEEKDYGRLVVHRTAERYLIEVQAQSRLVVLGYDSIEPWLGSLLFVLDEVCNGTDLTSLADGNWLLPPNSQATFWKHQRGLRVELNAAATQPRLRLTMRLMYQYAVFVHGPQVPTALKQLF